MSLGQRLSTIQHELRGRIVRFGHLLRRWTHRRSFKLTLAVIALLGLAGAWAATLIEPSINTQDPAVVARQFMQDLQMDRPNHAYELASPKLRKDYDNSMFASQAVPAIMSQWPTSDARYVGLRPIPGHDNQVLAGFIIPSDGDLHSQQVTFRLVRTKAGAPWQVDATSSITNINGKVEPGAI